MIDNPNPNNFYSEQEMLDRENYIKVKKAMVIENLKDIIGKIENEEPFPHGNIDFDKLCNFDDTIEDILENWYY